MPFYTWLRARADDSAAELAVKKRAARRLRQLRSSLRTHIEAQAPAGGSAPADSSQVLRLATWNLREFDGPSYGYRMDEASSYIAEILSHFDLIAVQEVREDLGALRKVMRLLGSQWDFLATDVTPGTSGNRERMAYVFNRQKVWFRDVAGELTLQAGSKVDDPYGERFRVKDGPRLTLPGGATLESPTDLRIRTRGGETQLNQDLELPLPDGTRLTLPPGSALSYRKGARLDFDADDAIIFPSGSSPQLTESAAIKLPAESIVGGKMQFARTPFIASFQAGWLKLNLCTVHILYGSGQKGLQRRNEEIQRLTKALADRAKSDSDSDADSYFIALGDFNIVGRDHETMASLKTNDFQVPEALTTLPGSNVAQDKFYDQIAVWSGQSRRRDSYTRVQVYRAGVFDFFETVFRSDEEDTYRPFMRKPGSSDTYQSYPAWRTYQMSDHLPMWMELHVDFADDYLETIEDGIDERLED